MRDVPCIAVKVKNDRAVLLAREKPSVQLVAVLGVEVSFLVLKTKLFWSEVKTGLRKVDEKALDPGIEQIEGNYQNQYKHDQVRPVDRHEQHLPERFFSR